MPEPHEHHWRLVDIERGQQPGRPPGTAHVHLSCSACDETRVILSLRTDEAIRAAFEEQQP